MLLFFTQTRLHESFFQHHKYDQYEIVCKMCSRSNKRLNLMKKLRSRSKNEHICRM